MNWNIAGLGRIEHLAWPHVSGWIAVLASGEASASLQIGDDYRIALRATIDRPDVESFLGTSGVGGFQVDLGSELGYSEPAGTPVVLLMGEREVDRRSVDQTSLGSAPVTCTRAHEAPWRPARSRFSVTPAADSKPGWASRLEALGIVDEAVSTSQWARYLMEDGLEAEATAGWLARRAFSGLGVPFVDPLPAAAVTHLRQPTGAEFAAKAALWTRRMLGESAACDQGASAADVDSVCVAGLVGHRSGLGQNAAHSITALTAAVMHVCEAPFFPAPGGWNRNLGPEASVGAALADHMVLLHLPVDRVVQSLSAQPALLASPRIAGYFMWETETIPRVMHRSLRLVDEVWTATEFVANAVREVTDKPVHVTGHAVDVSDMEAVPRRELGIPEEAFVVHFALDANSTIARKNPGAVIDAFHLAFEHDPSAVLVLKVRNMQQAQHLARQGDPHARGLMERLADDPAIVLVTGEWSHGRTLGLVDIADVFVSLHRSEGYGYGIAEAMALGTPVVATDYSGSSDLLSEETGWPVPYHLVGLLPEEYFYWEPGMAWAEPNIEAAAESLRQIRAGQGVALRVAAARIKAGSDASLPALQRRYLSAIRGS